MQDVQRVLALDELRMPRYETLAGFLMHLMLRRVPRRTDSPDLERLALRSAGCRQPPRIDQVLVLRPTP